MHYYLFYQVQVDHRMTCLNTSLNGFQPPWVPFFVTEIICQDTLMAGGKFNRVRSVILQDFLGYKRRREKTVRRCGSIARAVCPPALYRAERDRLAHFWGSGTRQLCSGHNPRNASGSTSFLPFPKRSACFSACH